ncbi:MAG: high-potential iron-sulfur protein [Chromatiaceae bacterium]
MSDKPMNKSRRDAVKMVLGGLAAVPLVNLVGMAAAHAEDLPHVDPATDPTAIALKYVSDATKGDRAAAARPGLAPDEQFCHNCQFVQADSGAWRPCQLFPGKAVNENGWCSSWTLKAGA